MLPNKFLLHAIVTFIAIFFCFLWAFGSINHPGRPSHIFIIALISCFFVYWGWFLIFFVHIQMKESLHWFWKGSNTLVTCLLATCPISEILEIKLANLAKYLLTLTQLKITQASMMLNILQHNHNLLQYGISSPLLYYSSA